MTHRSPFRYFKTSPEIIRLAVMMYIRFPLSLRNVEDLLHERGIEISHETVRFWWNRFGPMFAAEIRSRRVGAMRACRPRAIPARSRERKVVVAMIHSAKGEAKIVPLCTLPLTAARRVSLMVTELAVIEPTDRGLVLREMAPGVTLDQIRAATTAKLIIGDDLREMDLGPWRAAPQ
jgi:hypothetical protein